MQLPKCIGQHHLHPTKQHLSFPSCWTAATPKNLDSTCTLSTLLPSITSSTKHSLFIHSKTSSTGTMDRRIESIILAPDFRGMAAHGRGNFSSKFSKDFHARVTKALLRVLINPIQVLIA
jgi:hypothetical protein